MFLHAENVTLDDDEGQFVLVIDAGEEHPYTVNIHGTDLEAFYDQVKARLGPYLREMRDAQVAHGAMKRAEYDDAYALSDPKHPDFHSVHANIWDARADR